VPYKDPEKRRLRQREYIQSDPERKRKSLARLESLKIRASLDQTYKKKLAENRKRVRLSWSPERKAKELEYQHKADAKRHANKEFLAKKKQYYKEYRKKRETILEKLTARKVVKFIWPVVLDKDTVHFDREYSEEIMERRQAKLDGMTKEGRGNKKELLESDEMANEISEMFDEFNS